MGCPSHKPLRIANWHCWQMLLGLLDAIHEDGARCLFGVISWYHPRIRRSSLLLLDKPPFNVSELSAGPTAPPDLLGISFVCWWYWSIAMAEQILSVLCTINFPARNSCRTLRCFWESNIMSRMCTGSHLLWDNRRQWRRVESYLREWL